MKVLKQLNSLLGLREGEELCLHTKMKVFDSNTSFTLEKKH